MYGKGDCLILFRFELLTSNDRISRLWFGFGPFHVVILCHEIVKHKHATHTHPFYLVSWQVFSNSDEAPINKKLPKELLLR